MVVSVNSIRCIGSMPINMCSTRIRVGISVTIVCGLVLVWLVGVVVHVWLARLVCAACVGSSVLVVFSWFLCGAIGIYLEALVALGSVTWSALSVVRCVCCMMSGLAGLPLLMAMCGFVAVIWCCEWLSQSYALCAS